MLKNPRDLILTITAANLKYQREVLASTVSRM
jgi:hypothetical protein